MAMLIQSTAIEEVRPTVTKVMPDVLVCDSVLRSPHNEQDLRVCSALNPVLTRLQFSASMWTDEQAREIHSIAREIKPDIKTHALPPGLQVERGPDAVVEYLCEKVPGLLDS